MLELELGEGYEAFGALSYLSGRRPSKFSSLWSLQSEIPESLFECKCIVRSPLIN
jgi:hypothetical protein